MRSFFPNLKSNKRNCLGSSKQASKHSNFPSYVWAWIKSYKLLNVENNPGPITSGSWIILVHSFCFSNKVLEQLFPQKWKVSKVYQHWRKVSLECCKILAFSFFVRWYLLSINWDKIFRSVRLNEKNPSELYSGSFHLLDCLTDWNQSFQSHELISLFPDKKKKKNSLLCVESFQQRRITFWGQNSSTNERLPCDVSRLITFHPFSLYIENCREQNHGFDRFKVWILHKALVFCSVKAFILRYKTYGQMSRSLCSRLREAGIVNFYLSYAKTFHILFQQPQGQGE